MLKKESFFVSSLGGHDNPRVGQLKSTRLESFIQIELNTQF